MISTRAEPGNREQPEIFIADLRTNDKPVQLYSFSCSSPAGEYSFSISPICSTMPLPGRFSPRSSPATLIALWSPRFSPTGAAILRQLTIGCDLSPLFTRSYGLEVMTQIPPNEQGLMRSPNASGLSDFPLLGVDDAATTKDHHQGILLNMVSQSRQATTSSLSSPLTDIRRLVVTNAIGALGLCNSPGILTTHGTLDSASHVIIARLDSTSIDDSSITCEVFRGIFSTTGKDSSAITQSNGIFRGARDDKGPVATLLPHSTVEELSGCEHRSVHTKFGGGRDCPRIFRAILAPLETSYVRADGRTREIIPTTRTNGNLMNTGTHDHPNVERRMEIPATESHSEQESVHKRDQCVKWVTMSAEAAERANQAVRKLRLQMEKNRLLESTVKQYKKERLMIYDAAMRQATKREAEGIEAARLSFQRQQNILRTQLDQELLKVNDLYQMRCQDYAQMVSDEVEEEMTKTIADLREDWARQKKTIAQVVRDGGEDRQVSVIARAVVEQLAEEKKDEIKTIREEIHAEVQAQFENRETTMREALQNESRAELEGQLLLAEIRHQKEMDHLRMELSGGVLGSSSDALAAKKGPYATLDSEASGSCASLSSPRACTRQRTRATVGQGSTCISVSKSGGQRRLLRKLPTFKTPVQKPSHGSTPTKTVRLLKGTTFSSQSLALEGEISCPSSSADQSVRASVERGDESDDKAFERGGEEKDLDEGITSSLVISPTKSVHAGSARRSSNALDFRPFPTSTGEPPRPAKKAKRLFSSTL